MLKTASFLPALARRAEVAKLLYAGPAFVGNLSSRLAGAGGGGRTHMTSEGRGILSPVRLPVPPLQPRGNYLSITTPLLPDIVNSLASNPSFRSPGFRLDIDPKPSTAPPICTIAEHGILPLQDLRPE